MLIRPNIGLHADEDELKGFSRTVAEIEWLLLILVLIYLVAGGAHDEGRAAISMALGFFGAFILCLHYFQSYRRETSTKLAIETLVMIAFITWGVWYAGKMQSPLLNLYLLPIIASALILGRLMTAVQMLAVGIAFMALHYDAQIGGVLTISYWGALLARLAPVILVAYITTMLAADIRFALDKIKRVSDTDALTGIYNMRAFTLILSRTFKQSMRYTHPLSVIMIDCDNLKAVNDTYGHEAGNRLLQHVVRCAAAQLRSSDILARFGGDEFIAMLPETSPASARAVAERIRRAVEAASADIHGTEVKTSVSVGLAGYPDDGSDLDVIMDKADKAMYRAKQAGRNRVIATHERD
ncbi:MAG: GGDEF domain-containing protein [Betaproteobacteria bacterium]